MLNQEAVAQNGCTEILAPLLTSYVTFINLFNFSVFPSVKSKLWESDHKLHMKCLQQHQVSKCA